MTEKTNRLIYFDYLRVFAVFAVILIHVEADYIWDHIGTSGFFVYDAIFSASRWCVPVFVMISGALFLDPAREISLKKLYRKNLLRLLCAFMFWSLIYAIVDYLEGVRLREVVFNLFCGHYHLWYLFMLAGLYAVVPILRKVTGSKKLTEYFLILWFVGALCLQTVIYLAGFAGAAFVDLFTKVEASLWFRVAGGYSGYFVIGYYLNRYELTKKIRMLLYGLGALGFILSFILPILYYKLKGFQNCNFYDYLTVNVCFLSVAAFVFAKQHIKTGHARPFIRTLSDCSFGIYLVHLLFAEFADKHLGVNAMLCHPAVSVPLLAICIFTVSFLVTSAIRKLPFLGRYIA